jgi:hypothetical protein
LTRGLEDLQLTAADPAVLADEFNRAIADAAARAESSRQRPAPNEVLDFLKGVESDACSLLGRLGQDRALAPIEPVQNHRADWFVHLRRELGMLPDLPFWLGRDEVLGLQVDQHAARGRKAPSGALTLYGGHTPSAADQERSAREEVASALLHAAPTILALMATAAHEGVATYSRLKVRRGTRPDVFRRTLFGRLFRIHELMFGVPPRTRDSDRERCGPSVRWIVRVLTHAAQRARKQDYPGGNSVRELAGRARSTLAKQLEEAGTVIRRKRGKPGAGKKSPLGS